MNKQIEEEEKKNAEPKSDTEMAVETASETVSEAAPKIKIEEVE